MKFVLFVLAVLAVLALVWLLRGSRRRVPPPQAPSSTASRPEDAAQTMVRCEQCGVHLPRNEALPGRGGVFCGEAHRADYERQHPSA